MGEYFGSVSDAMLRLYMTVSDGIHWGQLADPMMEHCNPWVASVFVLYSGFVTFAMMNVVTAFFVEAALRVAHDDFKKHASRQLWELFKKADSNQSDDVSYDKFMRHVEQPFMQEFLRKLELVPDETQYAHVFKLLDRDGSGFVDFNELMAGCLRLMGPAKSVDLASLALTL